MPEYIVYTKEIVIQPIKIEAENEEEAIMYVREGLGEALERESVECLDSEEWTVSELQTENSPGGFDEETLDSEL